MTSSSEESDGERMRLQEAVSGIPERSKQGGPSKKKRPSKRATTIADDDGCSKLVTTDTQTFLAKKLSEHLDSVYKLVSPSHTTCEGTLESEAHLSDSTKTNTCAVRLFHDSLQPVTLDEHHSMMMIRKHLTENASKQDQHCGSKRKRKKPPSDSESSESESEAARLREAVVDSSTLLQQRR